MPPAPPPLHRQVVPNYQGFPYILLPCDHSHNIILWLNSRPLQVKAVKLSQPAILHPPIGSPQSPEELCELQPHNLFPYLLLVLVGGGGRERKVLGMLGLLHAD